MSQKTPQNDKHAPAELDDGALEEIRAEQESDSDGRDAMDVLQRDLREMEEKARDHWDQFVRAQAELDNLHKRTERDLANAHKYALEKFANELLPVKDSLEMGLSAAEDGEGEANIREGMELTLRMFNKVLTKFGIEEVDPVGERFDPERHQAMTMQSSDEHSPNTVLEVMQKGYVLNGRLLRPAMVVVSKASD